MSYGTVKPSPAKPAASESSASVSQAESTTYDGSHSPPASAGDRDNSSHSLIQSIKAFYNNNIGLFFVFVAQFFGTIMSMTTRLLETSFDTKFHALQIIFVRMFATGLIGSAYMWYKKVPDFPLGNRSIRGLLLIRGLAGSSGLFGLYYSLSYLDISDATVITFLVPTMTAFVCWVALREPFTIKEASAGMIAFVGVLFIARPGFLFNKAPSSQSINVDTAHLNIDVQGGLLPPVKATPAERSVAILCSIFGSFMAASAYATIRVIGKRAHSLVSVNYFAVIATISSFSVITIHPDLHFEIPQTPIQWVLLTSIGISGFLLQLLLTEGLQREKAGRATNLIYTQMVFALIIERIVWGTTPPLTSFLGSALIIGAAIWVSLQKKAPAQDRKPINQEERGLLGDENEDN